MKITPMHYVRLALVFLVGVSTGVSCEIHSQSQSSTCTCKCACSAGLSELSGHCGNHEACLGAHNTRIENLEHAIKGTK